MVAISIFLLDNCGMTEFDTGEMSPHFRRGYVEAHLSMRDVPKRIREATWSQVGMVVCDIFPPNCVVVPNPDVNLSEDRQAEYMRGVNQAAREAEQGIRL